MARELPNRSAELFGREPDLEYLLARAGNKGVTAVLGRAQMGKSWLLTEAARRLAGPPSPYLIGFMESQGESSDLFLRAIADLYTRWLSDSTWAQQAAIIWEKNKKDLVSNVGKAVGVVFEKVAKVGPKPFETVGGLVKETFDGLASANRELLSGGIQLPRLQIDQGRDLLALVFQITNSPMVLIMDQWEKSRALELETNILDGFVRHLEDWPPCHVFVGSQSLEKPLEAIHELQNMAPGRVDVYELPPMHLDQDDLRTALTAYVRSRVPAASHLTDEELLNIIAGYPGTVGRWTDPLNPRKLTTTNELRALAGDANSWRYKELNDLLTSLSKHERELAVRLALLPSTSSDQGWRPLKQDVLHS
jgi:hypothetical protein